MRSTEFEFYAPTGLSQALELLDAFQGEAKVLAGGMSMMPAMNLGLLRPEAVVSLNHIPGLDAIREDDGALRIGAMARHMQVADDPLVRRLCPFLSAAASVIGDVQIRNRGTIGGSLAHADPAGDYLPVMVAGGAELTLEGSRGRRTIPAREFFVDVMRTRLEPAEILIEITLPKLAEGARSGYARLVRVEGNFAIVNAAALVTGDSATVAIGGATSTPVLVQGDVGDLEALGEAAREACADAYGDLSGSSDYRRAMASVYAQRAVRAALGGD